MTLYSKGERGMGEECWAEACLQCIEYDCLRMGCVLTSVSRVAHTAMFPSVFLFTDQVLTTQTHYKNASTRCTVSNTCVGCSGKSKPYDVERRSNLYVKLPSASCLTRIEFPLHSTARLVEPQNITRQSLLKRKQQSTSLHRWSYSSRKF